MGTASGIEVSKHNRALMAVTLIKSPEHLGVSLIERWSEAGS